MRTLRPDDRQTAIDLAIDLSNVGAVLRESVPPDLTRAAALYRESLVLRERAATQDRIRGTCTPARPWDSV